MTKTTKAPTKIAPALARGAEGKGSINCRRSLDEQRGLVRKPRQEAEVTTAQAAKAIKKASAPKAKRAKATGPRLALKQNKSVRGLLTAAAVAAGATRLQPIGFASYSEFLAGVPLDASGNADVAFVPVKGNAPITGKNVKLTIRDGKVTKVA